ncbi:unnamed protein product [Auanema sp. JU1783]|nr:unnamed protein product [Auanema sp. JU1783]
MAFLAAMFAAKSLMDKASRNARPQQIARTSATISSAHNLLQPRKKHINKSRGDNPFEKRELMRRMGGYGIRKYSTKPSDESLRAELQNENWNAVYRYPGVRFGVILARAKLLQTVASVLYLPYSSYQFYLGVAEPTWYYTTAGLAIAAPIFLALFSRYLNRLIGVIAMNDSNDYIRVGYLTFWGSRKNKYVELTEVLPLSEMSNNKSDALVKFSWFGSDSYLYLPTKHAEIVDEERAELLFGDLSIFDHEKKA